MSTSPDVSTIPFIFYIGEASLKKYVGEASFKKHIGEPGFGKQIGEASLVAVNLKLTL